MTDEARIRVLAGAREGEATVDAVERLVARAQEWDLIRGKAQAWDTVVCAVRQAARRVP